MMIDDKKKLVKSDTRVGRKSKIPDIDKETRREKPEDIPETKTGKLTREAQLDYIRDWIKKVRFKRALFGVDEADVWKKLGELNSLYEATLAAERSRYNTLFQERVNIAARYMMRQYGAETEAPDEKENNSEEPKE